ncbi:MAG: DUF4190 domain-containing protein [Tepidisphaeraceae bacterium]
MLTFSCGVCRTTLQAPDEKAGGKVRCPSCKAVLMVPMPEASVVGAGASDDLPNDFSPSPAPMPPPVNRGMVPPPAVGGGRRYGFNCQYCSSRLEAQDSNAGQSGQCPTCGQDIIVPILDRYGRLIDPMTGKVIKPDPHPVHAYAAAGERAPRIFRQADGKQSIQCPRCRSVSPITANNCSSCGMPFTMEGTTIEATGASNGYAVASLVLGIIGLPTFFCLAIPSILALVFGGIAYAQASREGSAGTGRGMAIAGLILGLIGLAFALLMWLNS